MNSLIECRKGKNMNRSKSRELAFKLVYEREIQKEVDDDELEIFLEANEIENDEVKEYLKDILFGISENQEKITELIKKNLKENWEIDRVSKINISLLKVAIYEIIYKNIPYKVAINEVVELAKKYSDEQGSSFVNGILASIVKEEKLDIGE